MKRKLIHQISYFYIFKSPENQLCITSDHQRLRQVLLNLLSNAIKYNREGFSIIIKTEIRPITEEGIENVRISISDAGAGIAPEDIPKLFKPFECIGTEKTATEGTGLGLQSLKN